MNNCPAPGPSPLIPILTAIVAAIAVLVGGHLARSATKYSAHLQALQRARDAELANITEFGGALMDALAAVQSYTFTTDAKDRRNTIDAKDWPALRDLIEEPLTRLNHADYLADALPWEDVRAAYLPTSEILHSVLSGIDEGEDPWTAATKAQPTKMTLSVQSVAEKHRELLNSYPIKVPK